MDRSPINWVLIGLFFQRAQPASTLFGIETTRLVQEVVSQKKEKKDLFKKFGSARKFPTATVKVKGGNFNQ